MKLRTRPFFLAAGILFFLLPLIYSCSDNIEMPRETIVKIVLEEGYSRMPVYRDTIDNIIGVVYTKDLLGLLEFRDLIILQDIVRPAYFVPETKKISQLMRELQAQKIHLAIVIDEFGGTEGIITMEDISKRSSARSMTSTTRRSGMWNTRRTARSS